MQLPNRHKISRPFEDFASQGAASVKSSGHRSEGYDNQMLDDGTQPLIDDGDNHVGDNGGDDKVSIILIILLNVISINFL